MTHSAKKKTACALALTLLSTPAVAGFDLENALNGLNAAAASLFRVADKHASEDDEMAKDQNSKSTLSNSADRTALEKGKAESELLAKKAEQDKKASHAKKGGADALV